MIRSKYVFRFVVWKQGLTKSIQSGTYSLSKAQSLTEIAQTLTKGTDDVWVTVVEGLRREEVANVFAHSIDTAFDTKEFLTLTKGKEGYLFPDTYLFNSDIEEEELVNYLLATFESKTEDVFTADKIKKTGLTKEQIIVLASIVERETRTDEEKPVIAGILIKRLNEGAKLEADATTQYAVALKEVCSNFYDQSDNFCTPTQEDLMEMDWWPSTLTIDDINFENQYNTRKVTGLPPAPISSVGLSSINGVVNYAETDYYFYLHGSNGDVHYARTLDEHNANIANYIN